MSDYNYTEFSTDQYDLTNFHGPRPGDKAPDFELQTVDGTARRLLDFKGKFLVLEMGSITCPLFQSRRSKMEALQKNIADVDSAILYVREAHPGVGIGAHKSLADKKACATKLRSGDGETREILLDGFEGEAHQAYGGYPNSVFIINRNGCVVYFSSWNNPSATTRAVNRLLAEKTVRGEGYFLPAKPPALIHTFRQAGRGSALDFFKGLPKLAWNNLIKRNLRILFGRGAGIAGDTEC